MEVGSGPTLLSDPAGACLLIWERALVPLAFLLPVKSSDRGSKFPILGLLDRQRVWNGPSLSLHTLTHAPEDTREAAL